MVYAFFFPDADIVFAGPPFSLSSVFETVLWDSETAFGPFLEFDALQIGAPNHKSCESGNLVKKMETDRNPKMGKLTEKWNFADAGMLCPG